MNAVSHPENEKPTLLWRIKNGCEFVDEFGRTFQKLWVRRKEGVKLQDSKLISCPEGCPQRYKAAAGTVFGLSGTQSVRRI